MLPFWITIEKKRTATPLNLGVGITAISETDARNIFAAAFGNEYQIASVSVVDDVGHSTKTTSSRTWAASSGAAYGFRSATITFELRRYPDNEKGPAEAGPLRIAHSAY